jgi:hypothetical protein
VTGSTSSSRPIISEPSRPLSGFTERWLRVVADRADVRGDCPESREDRGSKKISSWSRALALAKGCALKGAKRKLVLRPPPRRCAPVRCRAQLAWCPRSTLSALTRHWRRPAGTPGPRSRGMVAQTVTSPESSSHAGRFSPRSGRSPAHYRKRSGWIRLLRWLRVQTRRRQHGHGSGSDTARALRVHCSACSLGRSIACRPAAGKRILLGSPSHSRSCRPSAPTGLSTRD